MSHYDHDQVETYHGELVEGPSPLRNLITSPEPSPSSILPSASLQTSHQDVYLTLDVRDIRYRSQKTS